ncbi:MAG: hypothetical protein RQ757_03200 [Pseudomonadales bacterium]|nr:hypothetical protein [Pseudomonadales bacterium]
MVETQKQAARLHKSLLTAGAAVRLLDGDSAGFSTGWRCLPLVSPRPGYRLPMSSIQSTLAEEPADETYQISSCWPVLLSWRLFFPLGSIGVFSWFP